MFNFQWFRDLQPENSLYQKLTVIDFMLIGIKNSAGEYVWTEDTPCSPFATKLLGLSYLDEEDEVTLELIKKLMRTHSDLMKSDFPPVATSSGHQCNLKFIWR